jgi:class 3 adenylate cyclase
MKSFNMSAATLPVAHVANTPRKKKKKDDMRTERIVESLVWFSFHIPRTVLEDLIAHELELWSRQQEELSRRSGSKRKSLLKRTGSLDEDDAVSAVSEMSSLSGDGNEEAIAFSAVHAERILRREGNKVGSKNNMILPKDFERESAILFVDMSGFTKLSTMLDVESLSKVINSYFDMIVSEVIQHGGDILKFAGDAFFAEWRAVDEKGEKKKKGSFRGPNALKNLNMSLISINDFARDDDDDVPPLSTCVLNAAKCATAIVKKFSDYHVTTAQSASSGQQNKSKAMLNVHCGIGVGHLVGLHVGDYKEGQEEEDVELRREFLILGDPIEQVSG